MACSRTPKWSVRPPGLAGRKPPAPSMSVLLEGTQIRRAADQLGDPCGQCLDHPAGGVPGSVRPASEVRQGRVPVVGKPTLVRPLELSRGLGMHGAVGVPTLFPFRLATLALLAGAAPRRDRFGLQMERLERGVAERLLGCAHLVFAQRRSVSGVVPGFVRASPCDHGAHDDQRRPLALRGGRGQRGVDGRDVVAIIHLEHAPAVAREPLHLVRRNREGGVALDRYAVVVPHPGELREPMVPGQLRGLVTDAFHQVAVRAQRPDVMVDDGVSRAVEAVREPSLRQRHAHRVGDPLAERPGGGLHAGSQVDLGMSRGARAQLAEIDQFLERQVVSGQVQERVQQHRGMPAPTGRTGRGSASSDEQGCDGDGASRAHSRGARAPWASRDGRSPRAAPRPWRGRGCCQS